MNIKKQKKLKKKFFYEKYEYFKNDQFLKNNSHILFILIDRAYTIIYIVIYISGIIQYISNL